MIKVEITPKMLKEAGLRDTGAYGKTSFMNGKGNIPGFLGEYMVMSVLGDKCRLADEYDYDIICSEGRTIDVKTKVTTVVPKPFYEASIAETSLHQKVDEYVFCRVFKDKAGTYTHGWVIGKITKANYFKQAVFLKKNTIDKSNNYKVRASCYNLPYSKLNKFPPIA